jgi:hypothetical protein
MPCFPPHRNFLANRQRLHNFSDRLFGGSDSFTRPFHSVFRKVFIVKNRKLITNKLAVDTSQLRQQFLVLHYDDIALGEFPISDT